jgi:GDP-4-dehydro-6-deoxy-D-mannose reductase
MNGTRKIWWHTLGKKILITGRFGSVGTYMAEWIGRHHPGAAVYGIGRSMPCAAVKQCWNADLRDPITEAVIRGEQFDTIFHFASDADVAASFENATAVLDNNILSTSVLFDAVRKHSPQTTVVLASTSEVYGTCAHGNPIDEDEPIAPNNPYAVSKTAQDLLARAYFEAWGTKIIRVRMFSYFNPRRRNIFSSAFARQVAEIEAGMRTELRHGNLTSRRTFIDVRDACRAYWLAAEKCRPGEAYNVGGRHAYRVGMILEQLAANARCKIPTAEDPALLRPTDAKAQIPVCKKFFAETGWVEEISFQDSLVWLLDHYRREVASERLAV